MNRRLTLPAAKGYSARRGRTSAVWLNYVYWSTPLFTGKLLAGKMFRFEPVWVRGEIANIYRHN